jgi:predicted esterase
MPELVLPLGAEDSSLPPGWKVIDIDSIQGYPAPYIVEPTAPHTHTVILLHGLGSNGRAFGSFFLTTTVTSIEKDSPSSRPLNVLYPSIRWVFPSASWRRSTRFKRTKLSSWFDVFSLQDPSEREENQIEGLIESSKHLRDLIGGEVQKLNNAWGGGDGAEKRVIFGGLSQGCGISLITLLSLDYGLGGWVGMSGFLPVRRIFMDAVNAEPPVTVGGIVFEAEDVEENVSVAGKSKETQDDIPATKALNALRQEVLSIPALTSKTFPEVLKTPAFYGHGNEDEKVACKLGDELVETLRGLEMNIKHQVYPWLGHWIQAPEEIEDMISVFAKSGAWPDPVDGKRTA